MSPRRAQANPDFAPHLACSTYPSALHVWIQKVFVGYLAGRCKWGFAAIFPQSIQRFQVLLGWETLTPNKEFLLWALACRIQPGRVATRGNRTLMRTPETFTLRLLFPATRNTAPGSLQKQTLHLQHMKMSPQCR